MLLLCRAGPLVAAIDAQSSAAFTTLSFIQNIGFNPDGSLINQIFSFNVTNTTSGLVEQNTISVPLLTIIPIPYIRVRAAAVVCVCVCECVCVRVCVCA